MAKLTEEQLLRRELQATIRQAANLVTLNIKRRILNEIEPDMLGEFDKAVASGEPFGFELAEAVNEVTERLVRRRLK